MKLKTIKHERGDKYVEVHYNRDTEGFLAKFYLADGTFLKDHDFLVVSVQEVYDELALWATI